MRNPFTRRVKVSHDTLTALRRENIGWDHDPLTATLMMHRVPRVKSIGKGEN